MGAMTLTPLWFVLGFGISTTAEVSAKTRIDSTNGSRHAYTGQLACIAIACDQGWELLILHYPAGRLRDRGE
jgi:hypothetical protein